MNKVLCLSLFASVLFLTFPTVVFGQTGSSRGFMFQLGIGGASIEYPSDYQQVIEILEDLDDVSRLTLNLHLGLGFAVSSNLYASFLIDAVGDRLDDGFNFIQTNTYVYGFGVQGYPFETGLLLGAHIGPSRVVFQSDLFSNSESDWGTGFVGIIGWDFNRRPTGPSLMLSLRILGNSIEGDTTGAAAISATFLVK